LKPYLAVLKVELHSHTADDPHDRIPYSAEQLIDRAAALGYDALAITLHDRQLDLARLAPYAAERRLVLIPGIERTIAGKHVLLLNFPREAEDVGSFADLAALKQRAPCGLVVAPHPYFPARSCLWGLLEDHGDLFDAVEVNGMFTEAVDFNAPARRWAESRRVPLVGNGDVHRLSQLGTTYSLVDAPPYPDAICAAIAAGRVTVEATPLSWPTVGRVMGDLIVSSVLPRPHGPEPKAAYP
jgi:predicted metal-dependent phosphoesterase TrpH